MEDFGILKPETHPMSDSGIRANRFILLSTAILFSLMVQSVQSGEPAYNGNAISQWLGESDKTARYDAIRQIGASGIPTLLDILGVKQRNVKRVVSKLQNKELQEFSNKDADVEGLRSLAVDGFAALGTNAEPAIPRLVKMLKDDEISFQAARALTKVGPSGFSALTNALAGKNEAVRNNVVFALAQEGGADPKVITRLLINSLKDSDWAVRGNAAVFLAGKDPTVAIPVLTSMLDDKEYYPRHRAAIALGSYGPAAKSAAPKLLSMYTNSLDNSVFRALENIDQETAGKAEAFLLNSGPLNSARLGYTKSLLKNGKELITGGLIHTEIPTVANRCIANAEVMDSATKRWTETGKMNIARWSHTATLLSDGKVLVAGGAQGDGHALSSAELYDPTTGQWTETGSLHFARFYHKAILQPDGKVLVTRGNDNRNPLYSAELYDPATGIWIVVTNLTDTPSKPTPHK